MIRTGVVGASGYTGTELIRLLARHPAVDLLFATSESNAGAHLDDLHPSAPPLELIGLGSAPLQDVDLAFLCLPHGVSAAKAVDALNAGARVVDLSADFRLEDEGTYGEWYQTKHPASQLLGEAVYGLTEYARECLPDARLVANPGCYPTSILLPLRPLLDAGLISGTIIADSKSGVSGAGRAPKQSTHFVEVTGNFSPYKIGRGHRHLPEIEQQLRRWSKNAPSVIFSPHLLPVPRGILSTIYVPLTPGCDEAIVREAMLEAFAGEPFVKVLPAGQLASLAHANYTNRCVIGLTCTGNTLIITSAIDNLIKGAAGQAVQNMNVMFGLPEDEALP